MSGTVRATLAVAVGVGGVNDLMGTVSIRLSTAQNFVKFFSAGQMAKMWRDSVH
jgi:hypothetical protein